MTCVTAIVYIPREFHSRTQPFLFFLVSYSYLDILDILVFDILRAHTGYETTQPEKIKQVKRKNSAKIWEERLAERGQRSAALYLDYLRVSALIRDLRTGILRQKVVTFLLTGPKEVLGPGAIPSSAALSRRR